MKRHHILNQILKHILLPPLQGGRGVGLLLPLFLLSCNDIVTYGDDAYVAPENQPNTGAPEVFGVYEVRDVIYDTPLESIDPGQRIRIYGKNLNHVQRLTVGGFEADVAQAATALDYCIAYVPDQFSIPQNGGIEYTTDMGTTTYAITVRAHELELSGLANEFAPAGTTAAVTGRWFAAYGFGTTDHATVTLTTPAVPLTGSAPVGLPDGEGTTLEVVSVTNSGMSIAIPASAPDNSIITFRWLDVAGEQQEYSCHYRPTAYRCFETLNLSAGDSFNDQEGYDLAVSVEPDGIDGIPALGSPILRLSGHAKQWGWYSANIDSELKTPYAIAGQNDYDPTLTRGYTFEFEVMTLAPMPSSADADVNGLTFSMEWGDRVEWSPAAKNEEFSTDGQWQTVRLPLSEVAQRGLRPISWGGTTHVGIIISPIVDKAVYNLRLSNFRIVKELNATKSIGPDEPDTPDTPDEPDTPDTPFTPTDPVTVLTDTPTVITSDWSVSISIEADKFANAKVGDIVTVYVSDVNDGAQIKLANPVGGWDALAPSVDCIGLSATDTQFAMTISDDILAKLKANGMAIQGHDYTVQQVTLTATLE